MWIYSQTTGEIWDSQGHKMAIGYSGYMKKKNNPFMDHKEDGPIPKGLWLIHDIALPPESPVIPLCPADHSAMGRCDFFIKGDNETSVGYASRGDLVLSKPARKMIANSKDKKLMVIE